MKYVKRDMSQGRVLVVIGLVLTGLFSGILGTLWLMSIRNDDWRRPISVERVQLGSTSQPEVSRNYQAPGSVTTSIESLNAAFKNVASMVTPSVVFIEVESRQGENGLSRRFGRGGVTRSVGSGVIVSEQGFVVTNNHVVDGAQRISVTLSDKREYVAELIGTDIDTDLAVLRLRSNQAFQSIKLGQESELQVGEWVLAVGNPFRLTSTVTAGIVSALGRQVNVIGERFGIEHFIQTDAAINPGNSGGALVNLKGELVGIATAIATETGAYQGYGFAVPVDLMERVVRDLIQFGEVQRGYLGVTIEPIDDARARYLGLPDVRGVFLGRVQRGLAASNAGLTDGDVLLSIEGKAIFAPNELQSVIALYRPGETITVDVWRDGRVKAISVQLSGRDNPQYQSWIDEEFGSVEDNQSVERDIVPRELQIINLDDWGVGLANLSDRYRSRFDVDHGVYVAYVEQGGIFSEAGIPRNVLLLEINESVIDSIEQVRERLEESKIDALPMLLKVRRYDGVMMFFEITWPE